VPAPAPESAFTDRRTFLTNHMKEMASMDFFTVPTAWTAQQIRVALPWEAPKYLIPDRDAIFGGEFVAITKNMGIEEVVTAPRSPWRNPYVEQLIGSIRRECLDHVIVWNETSLRRTLRSFHYYQK
jgi:putative transposase